MTVNETTRTLDPFFKVEDKRPEREYLIIACKDCKARYSLAIKTNDEIHGGNVLSLLDHAGGHAGGNK